jgi:hypothetical protein
MASTYPTSLDSFTNPSATDLLTSPSHAQQHSDINDAIEAVQTKLAIGNTVAYYCRVNNFVHFYGKFTLGSTSAITGSVSLSLPINCDASIKTLGQPFGVLNHRDASTGIVYPSDCVAVGVANYVFPSVTNTASTFAQRVNVNSGNPFTWAVSDSFFWNLYYKAE